MRKKILFSLVFAILSILMCQCLYFNGEKSETAYADGRAEIAMELSSGQCLFEKNADARMPMASTTKVLTALIIIEDCDLDCVIKVPDQAVGVEGSSIYLKKEEEIDIQDLLYGLMLRSGNDSSVALAIHHSGSVEKFVEKMNDRAKQLGAVNSHFTNPNGLPDDDHYTTARDLCMISCAAMNNPTFKKVVSTHNYSGKFRSFTNKNKMLLKVEGANGVKTGYTVKAGRCLVSSAERDGMDVVSVVLNCPDMYERSTQILESCFNRFSLENLSKDKIYLAGNVPCSLDGDYKVLVERNKKVDYKVLPLTDSKRLRVGDEVGKLEIYCENDLIFSKNLYIIMSK